MSKVEARVDARTVEVDGQEQRRAILLMIDVTISRMQFSASQWFSEALVQ